MSVRTEEMGCSSSDEISLLPDAVIENILMCLPLQEAVRTSVLSKKWRYIWTRLPQLVFDNSFCNELIKNDESKLFMTIHQVLSLHRGSILKFKLRSFGLNSDSDIDQLILLVLKKDIKDFSLDIWKGEYYKLQSSFFSCVQLEHLNLNSCIVEPPTGFKGFRMLVSLEFHEVAVTSYVCSSLISSCPLLEKLTVDSLTLCYHLDIFAPSLRFFRCEGFSLSICFKSAPHLETLSINMDERWYQKEDYGVEMVVPFHSLPAIKYLELDGGFLKYMIVGDTPKRCPSDMIHLKILKVFDICFGQDDETLNLLGLIRSSPNLEKITIVPCIYEPATPGVLDTQAFSGISLNQLRDLEFEGLSGTKSELMFIATVLAKSPMLERMLIKPQLWLAKDKGLRILKEVAHFQRASPLAQITCSQSR